MRIKDAALSRASPPGFISYRPGSSNSRGIPCGIFFACARTGYDIPEYEKCCGAVRTNKNGCGNGDFPKTRDFPGSFFFLINPFCGDAVSLRAYSDIDHDFLLL